GPAAVQKVAIAISPKDGMGEVRNEACRATGMNNRQPGGSSSLDRGQSCLAEAWLQPPPVRRRIPNEDCPQAVPTS
ncbi:hypothetical protein KZZ20_06915, partial [Methylacidiphilum fumariolicum]